MADYREMYLTMFRASEQAVNILIDAQQKCEAMYMNAQDVTIKLVTAHDAPDEE